MNTPMMELIEWMDKNSGHCSYGTISGEAEKLLEKEKHMVIDAVWYGHDNKPEMIHPPETFGEEYYNQKYKI